MLPRIMHPTMQRLRLEFMTGARLTFHDVEARCFISARNGREYLKLLHSEGEIHICDWRRDSPQGPWVPVYLYGGNDNEPLKPNVTSNAERRKRWRQNEGVKEKEAALKRGKRRMKSVESIQSVVSFMLGIKNVS